MIQQAASFRLDPVSVSLQWQSITPVSSDLYTFLDSCHRLRPGIVPVHSSPSSRQSSLQPVPEAARNICANARAPWTRHISSTCRSEGRWVLGFCLRPLLQLADVMERWRGALRPRTVPFFGVVGLDLNPWAINYTLPDLPGIHHG